MPRGQHPCLGMRGSPDCRERTGIVTAARSVVETDAGEWLCDVCKGWCETAELLAMREAQGHWWECPVSGRGQRSRCPFSGCVTSGRDYGSGCT